MTDISVCKNTSECTIINNKLINKNVYQSFYHGLTKRL